MKEQRLRILARPLREAAEQMSLKISDSTSPPVPKPRARYKLKVGLRGQTSQDSDSVWYDSGATSTQDVSNEGNDDPLTVPSIDVPDDLPVSQDQPQLPEDSVQSTGVTPTSVQSTGVTPTSVQSTGVTPTSVQSAGVTPTSVQSAGVTPTSPTCSPSPALSPLRAAEPEPMAVSDSSNDEEIPKTPDSLKSDEELISRDAGEPNASPDPDRSDGRFIFGMTAQASLKQAETQIQAQLQKQKIPRAATIRVSRKKQGPAGLARGAHPTETRLTGGAVSRSSWLDVWKGRKHTVVWATLDGQVMSLWKKRTDKFTEYVFHVTSITNVSKQGSGRFSIHFGKKRFEFMAHNEVVQEGWVTSLLATRGTETLPPPDHHSSLIMKDPRTKVYAAICGHHLWLHNRKEDFTLGIGMTCVSMNVASVKQTGRHGFSLITPYKTFNFSADSSRELGVWFNCLNQGILSALSCSEVAQRLWASPWNKVCGDCGSANPEWASINLLLVICEGCAGQHRALGTNKSKVRSLKLDSKVWTEPLIKLFVACGNKAANDVWGYNIPAAEQILPDATPIEREAFIRAKYIKGLYRRSHPLASNRSLLEERLCQVVCGPDVTETLSLICSGARVLCRTGCDGPVALAEQAGQALQVELLRHNEFLEAPIFDQLPTSKDNPGLEELHGKLEDERFLFSQENQSAACDVLDLKEVIAVYDRSEGSTYEFDVLTLTDKLICNANTQDVLLTHLLYILKVVLPTSVEDAEVTGLFAASRVSVLEGHGLQHTEAWVALRPGEVLVFPTDPLKTKERLALSTDQRHNLNSTDNTIEMVLGERTVTVQFMKQSSCTSWYTLLQKAVSSAPRASQSQPPLTPPHTACDTVPPSIERCISHITKHGLKVEGLYRRCGIASKVSRLVNALIASPGTAALETNEQGVLDTGSALKQLIRVLELIPQTKKDQWVKAAAEPQETLRLQSYGRLVKQLPSENRVTLEALCGHLYLVQMHSQENRMTAQNLALVFVPTLFQELAMSTDMVRLTRELIIHPALVFQSNGEEPAEEERGEEPAAEERGEQREEEEEEIITVF
ncbi:arf-GAP with Rho-GAP domain, ANK repeat and PH domain-containing protein 1 isoform X2 [Clupea harengus]|uniref:Arf-GAP with Rho-GAP domain, ANK repeat and PH domain-containing protein 1 isoform X2 n=1 Tax=Clupea harengus TaxID=7950 RepID=A0A6P3W3B9_CLUHA|nr:arf-GAP with Rho-GAP domain, ANK repeat and PH domain-containing protein 1 isoform X2 [Clupea harengus]